VLQKEEKASLVVYVTKMQLIGHPMTLTQLWLKVVDKTQEKTTPLQNRWGWLRWFKK
jgi:hypothetical protein